MLEDRRFLEKIHDECKTAKSHNLADKKKRLGISSEKERFTLDRYSSGVRHSQLVGAKSERLEGVRIGRRCEERKDIFYSQPREMDRIRY